MIKEELENKRKLKLMDMAKEWLRTEHPEGNIQSLVNLILSFTEPKDKQIQIDAEQIRALQKQNGELTDKVKELQEELEFEKSVNGEFTAIEKLRELEKENAELRTRVENQKSFLERIRAKFNLGKIEKKEIEGYLESDQLTKAKEIIKILLKYDRGQFFDDRRIYEKYMCTRDEAEQFLKEVEKNENSKRENNN